MARRKVNLVSSNGGTKSAKQGIFSKAFNKVKDSWEFNARSRHLYDLERIKDWDEARIRSVRGNYLKQLSFFIFLFVVGIFILLFSSSLESTGYRGLSLGGGEATPTSGYVTGNGTSNDSNSLGSQYRTEEEKLTERLNSIYGTERWEFGLYQTEIDAYRVLVTLSDGTVVEHFYQVSPDGSDIVEVKFDISSSSSSSSSE